MPRGRMSKLDKAILKAVHAYPKTITDDLFLAGLIYEEYLGEARASIYGMKYCLKYYAKHKLPSLENIVLERERLIKDGKIVKEVDDGMG